jgi:peptide/nickel transport system substrate-binding protein
MSRNAWQKLVAPLISLCLLLALTACGQATPTEAPSVEEPSEEQVLRIAVQHEFDDLSPHRGGGPTAFWISMWWASPMYYDSDGVLHPYVFTTWEPNEDNTVWTFTIDENAVFSDGSPITAQDVVATWNLCAVPTTMHQRVGLFFAGVEGYEAVTSGNTMEMSGLVALDDDTVQVTLTSADPVFYKRVASHLISPAKASQAVGPDGEEVFQWWHPDNGVVTSGPFVPVSMDLDNNTAEFERNPNFWLAEPKLDRVILTAVTDSQTAITMFKNGELDAINELFTPTLVDELGSDFVEGPMIPRGHQFWLDWSKEPTNDINVRKALILAVDPDKVFEAAFPQGPGQAVHQLLVGVEGVDSSYVWYEPDPDAAREALAASSYGSAENLPKLEFVGISQASHELAAQYIVEQWRQVLGIEQVEMKSSYDDYSGPDQERIQIFRDDTGARFPDAVAYLMGAIYSSSGTAQGKMGGYSNAEVDALLEEASTISADDPRRVELALEAQELFLQDWMFIPYYHQNMPRYAMPYVMNWEKNLDWQVVEPWNVYIEGR